MFDASHDPDLPDDDPAVLARMARLADLRRLERFVPESTRARRPVIYPDQPPVISVAADVERLMPSSPAPWKRHLVK